MGLTNSSLGIKSFDTKTKINKSPKEKIIALAGNPNVGKSTIFNAFTGMNQHTGNWPGKTVCNAVGNFSSKKHSYTLVDIPGTYSLMAHSDEEEVARNFLCFGDPDGVIVVCDATMLLRNLNLVLQILEICPKTIVCINMMDEAKRKHIKIDIKKLSKRLSVPVVPVVAQKKKSLLALADTLDKFYDEDIKFSPPFISYPAKVEEAIATVEAVVRKKVGSPTFSRWISLKLLEDDEGLKEEMAKYFGEDFFDENIYKACFDAKFLLETLLIDSEKLKDMIVCSINKKSEEILEGVVISEKKDYSSFDRKLDKFFTSKLTGYPVMILLLALIFWITISGANYPSQLLSTGLFYIEDRLIYLFDAFGVPNIITDALIRGVYNVLAWVVSVMLPPMAIFFPLFTLLEDSGYLPRVAYNLDKPFQKCCACGKHALTMCMGF
ncbi:MAG: FeoB small GTPase domain-containing protein, partial [Acutalibacteraceae bacterium]